MRTLGFLLLLLPVGLCAPVWGETLYLTSGESIQGRIIRVDDQSITIESDKGFGTFQIKRKEILLIEFEEAGTRDLSRRLGMGYFHRNTPPGVGLSGMEYGVDALSFKMWLNPRNAVDVLLGFYSASDNDQKVLEVFSLELRFLNVFSRRSNLDLYWGGGLGLLNVTDNTLSQNWSGSGSSARIFLGVEMFLNSLPNLGISAELGLGSQSVGSRSVTNITTSSFPTFSMRYYY
ncbi:MAG: hypothetical protein OEW39_01695 [Deltaproteobacteria bacterium]|nr:hypothetical protein [Deltaproteobacteria bacterium]